MKKITVFLASSKELKEDRNLFEIELYRKCKSWFEKDVFLHLDIWEDLSARMSANGSQSEYDKHVQSCDLFVFLAYTKVGKYTEEEFENAFGKFKSDKKPFIFTYFKETGEQVEDSLIHFKQKLKDLGHFYSLYINSNDLWNQFNKELDRLEEVRFEKNEHRPSSVSSKISGNDNINIQGGTDNQIHIQTGSTTDQHAEKIYNIDKIDNADFS